MIVMELFYYLIIKKEETPIQRRPLKGVHRPTKEGSAIEGQNEK